MEVILFQYYGGVSYVIAILLGCLFGIFFNWWRLFRYASAVKSRFGEFYDRKNPWIVDPIVLISCILAGVFVLLQYRLWMWFGGTKSLPSAVDDRSLEGYMTPTGSFLYAFFWCEVLMTVISIIVALYRKRVSSRKKMKRPDILKKRDLVSVGNGNQSPRGRKRGIRCRPPQVVRWDIMGVMLSSLVGKIASVPLPRCLRGPVYRYYARHTGANLDEVEGNIEDFPTLRAFFTRHLKAGSRPIAKDADLVSPVDGKVVIFGRVENDRIEQVKGVTYSMSQFLGQEENDGGNISLSLEADTIERESKSDRALFHIVLYLNPGDYHRMHSPCDMKIRRLRHFPGTLFPITPLVTRLVPDLFALNERVVLAGDWKYGTFTYTAVGAFNVGSMDFNFDSTIKTNRLRRDFRNPNLCVSRSKMSGGFSRRDIGKFAYVSEYEPPVPMNPAEELGTFNLGSTVVLIFEAPIDFEFCVDVGDSVKLGQEIGRRRASKSAPSPGRKRGAVKGTRAKAPRSTRDTNGKRGGGGRPRRSRTPRRGGNRA